MRSLDWAFTRETKMMSSRRHALKLAAGAAGAATIGSWIAAGQAPPKRSPSTASGDEQPDPNLDPKRAKTILEQNKKDMKKDVEKLFQLATELKDEADKSDAMTVLSLPLLRKTEEIEKLARQIRDKAKG